MKKNEGGEIVKYLVMNQTCEWAVCTAGVFKHENGYELGWAKDDGAFWCKAEDELNTLVLDEDPMCVVNYEEWSKLKHNHEKLIEANSGLLDVNDRMQGKIDQLLKDLELTREELKKQVVTAENMKDYRDKAEVELSAVRMERNAVYTGIAERDELVGEFNVAVNELLSLLESTNGLGIRDNEKFKNAYALVEREALPDPQGYKPPLKKPLVAPGGFDFPGGDVPF